MLSPYNFWHVKATLLSKLCLFMSFSAACAQVKEAHELSLALLLDCLKGFWAYGILPSAAAAQQAPASPAPTR